MRVTNSMIMNNARTNINNNKTAVDKASTAVATGKKIQVPSDDPIIAVRALKLRNNLNELNQYYERNVKDATSWMKLSEDSLVSMRSALDDMYDSYVKGANGELNIEERNALKNELVALRKEIMGICNAKSAGRNIFTGYKTSTDFTFMKDDNAASYKITQKFSGKDISDFSYVSGITDFDRLNITGVAENEMPQLNTIHRLCLGYQGLGNTIDDITYVDTDGTTKTITPTVRNLGGTDENDLAYAPGDDEIIFIPETGELILGDSIYKKFAALKPDANGNLPIEVSYTKTGFQKYEARPEMYYDCTDLVSGVEYTKEDQDISYTVNFSQKLIVNTQISNVIGRDLIRNIDDLVNSLQWVESAQAKVDEIQEMIDSGRYKDTDLDDLKTHLESAQKELDLQKGILQDIMEAGVGQTQRYQESVDVAKTDVGNRKRRLKLIEERLSDQQTNFEDLKSENEDITESDALLDETAALQAYELALKSTAEISGLGLLNYL